MGKRGPPRLPTAIHLARGGHRGKTRSKTEPVGTPLAVDIVPKGVSRKGRAYWQKFAPILSRMGVLQNIDEQALVLLCKSCVDLDYAERQCDTRGWTMIEDGKVVESPFARIRDRLRKDIAQQFKQFGMTPASRSGVDVQFAFAQPAASTGTANRRPLGI